MEYFIWYIILSNFDFTCARPPAILYDFFSLGHVYKHLPTLAISIIILAISIIMRIIICFNSTLKQSYTLIIIHLECSQYYELKIKHTDECTDTPGTEVSFDHVQGRSAKN